ncbi:Beta-galactosidase C-terminal domain, partial [Bacillus inaquosorum]
SLSPVFPVRHGKGVSVQVRQDQDHDYVFIMNFTEEKQLVTFDQSVKDMITGEILSGDLTMEKYEVRIVVNTH